MTRLKYKGKKCFSFIFGKTYKAERFCDDMGEAWAIFDEGDDWYVYGLRFVAENFEEVAEDAQEVRRAV